MAKYKHDYNKEHIVYESKEEQEEAKLAGIKEIVTMDGPSSYPLIGVRSNCTRYLREREIDCKLLIPWKVIKRRINLLKPITPTYTKD